MVSVPIMPSGPERPAMSLSKAWPRRFQVSRAMRVPSAAVQVQASPCLPPVDSMMKCCASGGGLARSAEGV